MVSRILNITNIGEQINMLRTLSFTRMFIERQMQEIEWEIRPVGFTFSVWTSWGGVNMYHLN